MKKFMLLFASVCAVCTMGLTSCSKDDAPGDDNSSETTLDTEALTYWQNYIEDLLKKETDPDSGYTAEAFTALKAAKTELDAAIAKVADGTFTTQEEVDAAAAAAEQAVETFEASYVPVVHEVEMYVPGASDVSNYVEFGQPGAFDEYNTISVELWFKGDEIINKQQQGSIISNFDAPKGSFYGWEINTWANDATGVGPYKIRVSRGFEQGLIELQPGYNNPTSWHHIVYVHNTDNNKSYLYFDGSPISDSGTAITSAPKNPNHPIQMCGFKNLTDSGNPKSVSGCMKKVRFWSKALTEEEVQANMSKDVTGTEEGLIAAWDFTTKPADVSSITDKTGKHAAKVCGTSVEWRRID